jgi:uncharacterized membrane protein (DUF485 family)
MGSKAATKAKAGTLIVNLSMLSSRGFYLFPSSFLKIHLYLTIIGINPGKCKVLSTPLAVHSATQGKLKGFFRFLLCWLTKKAIL